MGILDIPGQGTWIIPEGWTFRALAEAGPGKCRSCGAHILWLINERSGKPGPFNHDGVSHFATCPQAKAWRKT